MSRNNSAATIQGFSVFQPALGAQLQFMPALGTPELDAMIDAFVPGPASIKEKRASICMDFCDFAAQTGEAFKFYPVFAPSFASTSTNSPASSSAMYDSGYGSGFNVSPVIADASTFGPAYATPSASSSPSFTPAPSQQTKPKSAKSRKSGTSSRTASDFSHIPGMKIMTKDGQDVTNSASRGCKTKEQRDHAHLMRIIKACDACRKKKVRCEPGHRKRTASQAQTQPETKQAAKKSKKAAVAPQFDSFSAAPDFFAGSSLLPLDETVAFPTAEVPSAECFEESWEQFVTFDEEPVGLVAPDYDFFFDPEGHYSPSSGSSASPSQSFTPGLSASASLAPVDSGLETLIPYREKATLPYLNPGSSHGSNYVDFNLYSPASSFLDEEPQQLSSASTSANSPAYADSYNAQPRSSRDLTGSTGDRVIDAGDHVGRAPDICGYANSSSSESSPQGLGQTTIIQSTGISYARDHFRDHSLDPSSGAVQSGGLQTQSASPAVDSSGTTFADQPQSYYDGTASPVPWPRVPCVSTPGPPPPLPILTCQKDSRGPQRVTLNTVAGQPAADAALASQDNHDYYSSSVSSGLKRRITTTTTTTTRTTTTTTTTQDGTTSTTGLSYADVPLNTRATAEATTARAVLKVIWSQPPAQVSLAQQAIDGPSQVLRTLSTALSPLEMPSAIAAVADENATKASKNAGFEGASSQALSPAGKQQPRAAGQAARSPVSVTGPSVVASADATSLSARRLAETNVAAIGFISILSLAILALQTQVLQQTASSFSSSPFGALSTAAMLFAAWSAWSAPSSPASSSTRARTRTFLEKTSVRSSESTTSRAIPKEGSCCSRCTSPTHLLRHVVGVMV
ncbi:uncharacterized protein E0L32_011901 [Thyridium curvatum]|uniref:Uncharacterized protein n=1 Tax=Thyridium curvatum TaxID=1093900 RepID=A0A507B4I4_9PEZI|nr:uncharacterized protein E0L32_011901 [Thyridium curvatum]TPX18035.1 hypothetical protein E0L32_011901 [Thyridium curvatum]